MYTVNPANKTSFEVYCDMKTDGGGWTVFHKRFNGFVGFYRNWDEYKKGFGDLRGEYWLGNEKIHQLTEIPSQLRVEINTTSRGNKYATYIAILRSLTRQLTTHCLLISILVQQEIILPIITVWLLLPRIGIMTSRKVITVL